jgi:hypothetical protein
MIRAAAMLGALALGLSACSGGSGGKAPQRPAPPPRSTIVVVPQVMAPEGTGGVIGSLAEGLTRRFGDPRIDLAEGDARKLQFAGSTCVLDIYLYPVSAGAAPTATHVAARLRHGGEGVETEACIREVERR